MSTSVFHIIFWTEGETNIDFHFGPEGEIALREDAERLVEAYRTSLTEEYDRQGKTDEQFRSRVGLLEMPTPDPRLKHPTPCDSATVDAVIARLQSKP